MKCVPQWPALFSSTEAAAWFGTVIAFLAMPLTKHAKTSEVLLFLDPKIISSVNLSQCELHFLPKGRQGQSWVSAWLPLFSRNLECRALEFSSPDMLYLIRWILDFFLNVKIPSKTVHLPEYFKNQINLGATQKLLTNSDFYRTHLKTISFWQWLLAALLTMP